ncbi:hypothetical protein MTR_5g091975 [Medicago truncatula]|uniref:Uncharacterized protein n=1 Tax=Medicago truncatula TaxID=3880 RepID=A0A072UG86_MEDTR|nr:hypothetical protein MTR_5g091975 [Medicago truncatula]
MAGAGQLNMIDSPSRGSRSVDCFERLEKSAKAPIVMFTWPKRSKPVKLSLSRKYVWIMGEGNKKWTLTNNFDGAFEHIEKDAAGVEDGGDGGGCCAGF